MTTSRKQTKPLRGPAGRQALEQRRQRALEMRVQGASYRAIAQTLGVSHQLIEKDVKTVLGKMAEANKDSADELRVLMTERYERVLMRLYPLAIGKPERTDQVTGVVTEAVPPSLGAVDRVLRLLENVAQIHGLNSVAITGADGGPVSVSIAELAEEAWGHYDNLEIVELPVRMIGDDQAEG
tara:strand:- start:50 stop:595 length:546 start_codon:yes stop_codon:yes gene_type:complete